MGDNPNSFGRRNRLAPQFVPLLLWGCTTSVEAEWTRPGALPGYLETDTSFCQGRSGGAMTFSQREFESCMLSLGWMRRRASDVAVR